MIHPVRLKVAVSLLILAGSTSAWGLVAMMPLEPTVLNSDLVVVATATTVGEAAEMNVALPGMKAPTKRWMRSTTLEVSEVILDADGTHGKCKTLTVLMMAAPPKAKVPPQPKPKPKPGQPIMVRPPISSRRRFDTKLKIGTSYVLLLKKMDGRKEFYLAPMMPHIQTASKSIVDRVRKIGNVDAWPWGKADGRGLQVAVIQGGGFGGTPAGEVYSNRGKVYLSVMVALRNTGAKPITVDLDPKHKAIQFEVVDTKGAMVQGDPYKNILARPRPGQSYAMVLEPGRMKLIGLTGPAGYGVRVQMELPTGPHKVRVVFALPPDGDAKANWCGSIRSGATRIEVKQRPTRLPGPVRRTVY